LPIRTQPYIAWNTKSAPVQPDDSNGDGLFSKAINTIQFNKCHIIAFDVPYISIGIIRGNGNLPWTLTGSNSFDKLVDFQIYHFNGIQIVSTCYGPF